LKRHILKSAFTDIPPSNSATDASEVHSYAKRGREAEDEPKDGSRVEKKKAAAKQRQWIEN
jgi:hypothetical protein